MEIEFLQPLDALTTYTITIGADAETNGGTPLGQPAVATFTTGGEVDETGPRILSVWPAVDAVVPTDLATVTVTFTEPVDPYRLQPTEMSALLELFLAREPVWNAAGDRMTLYLQHPLPAGVRLYGVFDESSIYDLVGNSNTATDSVSFTTAGTASLFPVRSDLKIYYYASGMGPYSMVRQTIGNIVGSTFERMLTRWDGTGFSDVQDHWRMSRGSGDLLLNGFIEDSGTVTFSPALTFLTLPVLAQWSGTSSGTNDGGAFTMAYTAVADGPYRERFSLDRDKAPDSGTYFDGCYTVEIQYSLTAAGAAAPFETGEISTYYTPGLGIYALEQYGYEYDGETVVDDWEESYWLLGAALDDRYENPR